MLQTNKLLTERLSAGCTDSEANCAWWASQGYCDPSSSYGSYVASNCQAACGLCSTGGSASSPAENVGCTDSFANCEWWASQGYCDPSSSYGSYMASNCRGVCGLCSAGGSASSPAENVASTTPAQTTGQTSTVANLGGGESAALTSALELANLINEYRAQHGKAAVPLSPAMMVAASVHVKDLNQNTPGVPLSASQPDPCSLHSWSTLSTSSRVLLPVVQSRRAVHVEEAEGGHALLVAVIPRQRLRECFWPLGCHTAKLHPSLERIVPSQRRYAEREYMGWGSLQSMAGHGSCNRGPVLRALDGRCGRSSWHVQRTDSVE